MGNPLAAGVPALQPPKPTQVMLSPDGRPGDVPVDRVQEALAQGFKVGIDMVSPDGTEGTIPLDRAHDAVRSGFTPKGQSPAAGQGMQESSIPKMVRATTGVLPAVGAGVGAAVASPGIVSTPAGAGLGAVAGTEAKQAINRVAFGNEEPSTVSKAGLTEAATQGAAAAGTEGALEGLTWLGGKALGGLSSIAKGEAVAQAPAQSALREAAGTSTPSLRESLEEPIEQAHSTYKDLYKQIDDAAGTDVKALREKLANTQQDIRELTDTEEDVVKEAKLEKARQGLLDKITQAEKDATAAGVPPDTLAKADKVFQQTQALKDVEAKVFKNPNVVIGNAKYGTNETVNVNSAIKAIQKLQDSAKYGGPRLEQAFGADGANNLLNNLYQAQRAGQKAVKVQDVAKWVLRLGGAAVAYEAARKVIEP